MLEQLKQLVQKFGNDAVVNYEAIPNEQNEAILEETSNSLFSALKNMVSKGDFSQMASLLEPNTIDGTNSVVKDISQTVSTSLTEKFGLSSTTATTATNNMIPQVLKSLVEKAKDPQEIDFNLSDIVNSLTGGEGAEHAGIMQAISTYGIHFGLDQNADGKLNAEDAAELAKKGGVSGMFTKLFGK